jgi:hypothetical protein
VKETSNTNRILIGKPERRHCSVDRDVDGRLILKCNLKGIFCEDFDLRSYHTYHAVVKGKLVIVLYQTQRHELQGSGVIAPHSLIPGTGWR